jgi:DNA-binding XRE family transcriptional regulator
MTILSPKPLNLDAKTVTFDRSEWEDFLEDIADYQAADRFERHVEEVGLDEVIRLSYTSAEVNRMLDDGVSAVTIWRERAGLTQRELAAAAGISQSYLAEIETGRKTGSLAAMAAIAKALRVPLEHLVQKASGEAAA